LSGEKSPPRFIENQQAKTPENDFEQGLGPALSFGGNGPEKKKAPDGHCRGRGVGRPVRACGRWVEPHINLTKWAS